MISLLLSICIPTYNRGAVLDNSLARLFNNPDFNQYEIEVIVSDNCSTDHTAEVVAKYPLVKYFKNETNIKDLNFSIALGYGKGKYIKLFNDTLSFKPNSLSRILRLIRENSTDENVFFFSNNFLNNDCSKKVSSCKGFIKETSYYTTWIANFGAWNSDFNNIKLKDECAGLQLAQVDWCYKIINNGKSTIIFFEDLFDISTPIVKGGYHIFEVFINNYLKIIKRYNLPFVAYEIEKYRLCMYFVYPWLIELFIKKQAAYRFGTKGTFKIIFLKYWYEPYLFLMIILFFKYKVTYEKNNK